MIKMDLSKFKHVSSDNHSTTLEHQDGHLMTLAHSALSKDAQTALKALAPQASAVVNKQEAKANMAEGGSPDDFGYEHKGKAGVGDSSANSNAAVRSSAPMPALPPQIYKQKKAVPGQWGQPEATPSPECSGGMIKGYDDGGTVAKPSSATDAFGLPVASPTPKPVNEFKNNGTGVEDTSGYARGGNVRRYADGTPDQPVSDSSDINKELNTAHDWGGLSPDQIQLLDATQHPMTAVADDVAAGATGAPSVKDALARQMFPNIAPKSQPDAASPVTSPNVPEGSTISLNGDAPVPPSAPADATPNPPPSTMPQMGGNDPEAMYRAGLSNQMTGTAQGAQAQGALGQAQAADLQSTLKAQQDAAHSFQQNYTELNNERMAHVQDIQNGHIDPTKYWTGDAQGNGSHSKLATGIGMILAGFNPTSHPNAAIDFLKYNMDKNLEAQAKNLDSKNNLLKANLQQFGNMRDAMDMTRIMQHDMVANQLQMEAGKAASPIAKAAALQAAGKLQMEAAPQLQNFAMRRAMMNLGGQSNPNAQEQMLNQMAIAAPEVYKEMEPKFVPGIGMATSPVPGEARKNFISYKNTDDLFNKSLAMTQQYGGMNGLKQALSDPAQRARINAQAGTIQSQLIGQVKQAQHDGVYKESEANYLLGQIGGSPTSFLANISSDPKIKEMQQINRNNWANEMQSFGGDLARHAQTLRSGQPQTSNQPSAPQIKTVNGIRYKRGPNGEAVRID